jgi:hypothetical protein
LRQVVVRTSLVGVGSLKGDGQTSLSPMREEADRKIQKGENRTRDKQLKAIKDPLGHKSETG